MVELPPITNPTLSNKLEVTLADVVFGMEMYDIGTPAIRLKFTSCLLAIKN
jgi:hypothetical protein